MSNTVCFLLKALNSTVSDATFQICDDGEVFGKDDSQVIANIANHCGLQIGKWSAQGLRYIQGLCINIQSLDEDGSTIIERDVGVWSTQKEDSLLTCVVDYIKTLCPNDDNQVAYYVGLGVMATVLLSLSFCLLAAYLKNKYEKQTPEKLPLVPCNESCGYESFA